ncbi:succinate dehydrogenase assembly factor 4, mitochondrial [Syngnathoides biaculeatus]|uniref:succinate dehydrogenase assembly factor 4, mitochondrial n=1 Tax=Syngnathoides biaculeatus TaxID=300417 RepID=UPI002ADE60DD|nr:succinate dehydrogenase assembly factor 4, mitochondrial [Syngnathoides biaculeatus]
MEHTTTVGVGNLSRRRPLSPLRDKRIYRGPTKELQKSGGRQPIHKWLGSSCSGWFRSTSGPVKEREPQKKAVTPQGRFDKDEEKTKDVLERFPEDVNPGTKEKGGPRGPEPTRYGDWERKGRCVDF